ISFLAPFVTSIYTLSLHDALPISQRIASLLSTTGPIFFILRRMSSMQSLNSGEFSSIGWGSINEICKSVKGKSGLVEFYNEKKRSEEHTSELQSLRHLVCRLLLEK